MTVVNRLNNRKAKLARVAAKDIRAPSVGDNTFTDKKGGSGTDPESADEFSNPSPSSAQGTRRNPEGGSVKHEQGQYVVLTDGQGEEIGKGRVHQASGVWSGTNLDESGSCWINGLSFNNHVVLLLLLQVSISKMCQVMLVPS